MYLEHEEYQTYEVSEKIILLQYNRKFQKNKKRILPNSEGFISDLHFIFGDNETIIH